ncbi:hypothetical protein M8J76_009199 [Diaphorina citri]|nr:hypothetical protein M8J76_009199 [Diaphorina citri]
MTAALPSVLFTFSTHDQNKNKNYKKFSFRFPSFVISCCPGIDRQSQWFNDSHSEDACHTIPKATGGKLSKLLVDDLYTTI